MNEQPSFCPVEPKRKRAGQTPGPLAVMRGDALRLVGDQRRFAADLLPDADMVGRLAQETEADDNADPRDHHRVEQAAQGDARSARSLYLQGRCHRPAVGADAARLISVL